MEITFDAKISDRQAESMDKYLFIEFKFKRTKISGEFFRYKVQIKEPLDAFWIGCNLISISNNLFLRDGE